MGMLDDVVGAAVPQGNLAKPLMLAVMALLASGALTRGSAPASASATPANPAVPPDAAEGGARTRQAALRAAERAAGHSLLEIESGWARAWANVLEGKEPWAGMRSEAEARDPGQMHPLLGPAYIAVRPDRSVVVSVDVDGRVVAVPRRRPEGIR